ncbi:hypothetical protein FACS1894103_2790 [Campylobacterota bacterium]|nr:hypothetical protein FACS1894103_2790 [Campylobacterota bacterium]
MKTITRTMRADQLPPIFDIPEDMRQEQVNVIVVPISDDTAVYRSAQAQTAKPAIDETESDLVLPSPEAQRIAVHKFIKEMRESDEDEPLGEEFYKMLEKRVTFKRCPTNDID